jgi:hypothetical protein
MIWNATLDYYGFTKKRQVEGAAFAYGRGFPPESLYEMKLKTPSNCLNRFDVAAPVEIQTLRFELQDINYEARTAFYRIAE